MNLPIKLYHYSKNHIKKLVNRKYFKKQNGNHGFIARKPCGLWVSIEDYENDINWREWCHWEQFRIESLRVRYSVKLRETAKILHISTEKELDHFTKKYVVETQIKNYLCNWYNNYISWETVSKEYDGIFIAPYQPSRRDLDYTRWYYGWDCASGCIWNTKCIESFQLSTESHSEPDQPLREEGEALVQEQKGFAPL